MNKLDYLNYISSHQNDTYWLEILNTSYDMLPHKLEVLHSEFSKNRYEIKKVVIDNLEDYLSSKETAIKMSLEIEKNKTYIKNARELIDSENKMKKNFDGTFYDNVYAFLGNSTMIFEIENLVKLAMKKGYEQNLLKLIVWLNKANETLNGNAGNKKLKQQIEKIIERIRGGLIEKILMIKSQETKNLNDILPFNLWDQFQMSEAQLNDELFKKELKKNIIAKIEKFHPLRGNNDYLVKLFYIYNKALEKTLQKIFKVCENFEKNTKIEELKYFQKFYTQFEKNFKNILKDYKEEESFIELVNYHQIDINLNCYLTIVVQNLLDKELRKISKKLGKRLEVLIRYAYLNNSFTYLVKKIETNNFEEVLVIVTDSKLEKKDKLQKILQFVRKNEILSLVYNNIAIFFHLFSVYLKNKQIIESFNEFIIGEIKRFGASIKNFLGSKKLLKEEDKIKIMNKIEKFLDIMFYLIKNNLF